MAPTLNATHATAPSPPPVATVAARVAGQAVQFAPPVAVDGRVRAVTSIRPHIAMTRTSHGPMVAAEAAPASRYTNQRARAAAAGPPRRQLAGSSPIEAC